MEKRVRRCGGVAWAWLQRPVGGGRKYTAPSRKIPDFMKEGAPDLTHHPASGQCPTTEGALPTSPGPCTLYSSSPRWKVGSLFSTSQEETMEM